MEIEEILNILGGELYIYLNLNDKKLKKFNISEKEIIHYLKFELNILVNIFNFFDSDSILNKLNNNKKINYNEELYFLLNESFKLYFLSEGKFNIFIGNEIEKRKNNLKPNCNKLDLNSRLMFNNFKEIIEIKKNNINLLKENIKIDLGGIAKGYIIDRLLEIILKKYGKLINDVLIDARGDIVCYGKKDKIIEIENPFNDISFREIILNSGAIITSGHNKQKFKYGSHIVGNKTDILTITLVSKNEKCYFLDALGTYLIQLNSYEVLEKIEFEQEYKNIECLLILNNGKVLTTSFF